MRDKVILDACCGPRMFWYDKANIHTIFMDCREIDAELCDKRRLVVNPSLVADFRELPFDDKTFRLVVFDPPHLVRAGERSWLAIKYGVLNKDTWREDIRVGFSECWRVLNTYGVLAFKWSSDQIPHGEVEKLFPAQPLFGDQRGKTRWTFFMKYPKAWRQV